MKIGSLCTGYGGLDMAVEAVTGATTAWVSDIDKGACKIIAHRFADVPNIGDLTTVDWSALEPVDILTAGYPCQPFSQAGRRQGTNDERHLWPHIRQAIRHLRPRLTVLENVAGHRSLGFDRVLGDMAEDGLHVRWASLRAADVGACHGRERVFIVVTDPRSEHGIQWGLPASGETSGWRSLGQPAGRGRTPGLTLLPTPDASAEKYRLGGDSQQSKSLAAMARRGELLPTPSAVTPNSRRSTPTGLTYSADGYDRVQLGDVVAQDSWDKYAPAIARHEAVFGRAHPSPTEPTGKGGRLRLAPAFEEWMMGLPSGWVTDVPGLTYNEALKALGNGVIPLQAETALRHMLAVSEAVA